jgi:hypothetical protein
MLAQYYQHNLLKAAAHIVLYVIGEILKISVGLFLNAVITYSSSGMYHTAGINAFKAVLNIDLHNAVSWTMSWVTVIINAVFCVKKIQGQISKGVNFFLGDKTGSKALTHNFVPFDPIALNILQKKARDVIFFTKTTDAIALFGNTASLTACAAGDTSKPLAQAVTVAIGQLPMSGGPNKAAMDDIIHSERRRPNAEKQDFREKCAAARAERIASLSRRSMAA